MRFYKLLLVVLCIFLLCGCQNTDGAMNNANPTQPQKTDTFNTAGVTPQPKETEAVSTAVITPQPEETEYDTANSVTVNGRTFTTEEITTGIRDTLNNLWYLHGDYNTSEQISSNKNLLLGKDVEYDLYQHLGPGDASKSSYAKMLYVVITNIPPLSSTEEEPRLYTFALRITEGGVESYFYTESNLPQETAYEGFYEGHDEMVYLGHYTMRIDEVTKPQYEQMDSEWVGITKRSIKLYMDANFDNILEPGNYNIFLKKFFKGDIDSIIFFEHEKGNIYWAFYSWVHSTGEGYPGLDRLALDEDFNNGETYKEYFERIKSDPAVSLDYSVKSREQD